MDSEPKCARVTRQSESLQSESLHVIATHVNSTSGATLFTSNSEVREKVALWLQQLINSRISIDFLESISSLERKQYLRAYKAFDGRPWGVATVSGQFHQISGFWTLVELIHLGFFVLILTSDDRFQRQLSMSIIANKPMCHWCLHADSL